MSFTTSIITGGSNNHETTSTEANAIATDFFSEGVVGAITNTSGVAPATGSFAVNAQGTPDNTVAVSAGTLYTTATPTGQSSQLLRTISSATENVTIAANSTGGTRYDWIYLEIDADNAADSDASASNVATLTTSRSTSSTTDDGTPPTYGTLLAVVTVANGFSTISNASISDRRQNAGTKSELTIYASTGNDAVISATGDDTNIDLSVKAKGTGVQTNGRPVAFRAYRSAADSVSTSPEKVSMEVEDFDFGGGYNTVNSRFDAPYDGVYLFNANISYVDPGDGQRVLAYIYVNGANKGWSQSASGSAATDPTASITMMLLLSAGDYVEVYGQATGGGTSLDVGTNRTWFSGHLIGRTD